MSYKKIEQIGEGSFGKVYRVQNEKHIEYAMKTLEPQSTVLKQVDFMELLKRFIREVKYQSSIHHPNIAEIIDYNLEATPPFFIMTLAEGTLANDIEEDRTLDGKPNQSLFDILSGLEAAHELGIIHRDLKPQNVLKFIDDKGGFRYAISDFGLITATESDSTALTASNVQGGTVMYAAPELLGNFKRATAAADIYSFGAILHDIFGGGAKRIPYTELSVTGAIGSIIQKCTKKLPVRRYKSIIELRTELYDVLNTHEVEFTSSQEKVIIELLAFKSELSEEEWDSVFILLDDNDGNGISNANIFQAVSISHIQQLAGQAPELLAALGMDFVQYVKEEKFDFDYCDIVASKLQAFYDFGDIGLKAIVTIRMLLLGTDNNRWYVERKFMKLAGLNISETLAKRIVTEIEVQGIPFDKEFSHLEWSVNATKTQLHPILQKLLGD